MTRNMTRRGFVAGTAVSTMALGACAPKADESTADPTQAESSDSKPAAAGVVDELLAKMTVEQKVAQTIVPAIRIWKKEDVTDLTALPELAEALRRHQYGGVILFGENVVDTDQTARLVFDLQKNNAEGTDAKAMGVIPYLVCADQEGGSVARLACGTRGTGSMAIGATGEDAEENARLTGEIFGEELSALGINCNLAPCIDIIRDLADWGMSTRVYSDQAEEVVRLGLAFSNGLAKSKVITTFKHFPGAGDGSDYPTAVHLSLDELREQGLDAYAKVIASGADMVMTSAVTFPAFDDTHPLADGVSKGCYPATLSPKIVQEMLHGELGFTGVTMTDALTMDQFIEEPDTGNRFFTGEQYSVETCVSIAEKALNAGCDILLMPLDTMEAEYVDFHDAYIAGIAKLVEEGTIASERVDEAVGRILALKQKYGILDLDVSGTDLDTKIEHALSVVGSDEHHAIERSIAERAVTLVADDGVLPLPGTGATIVIVGRTASDFIPISSAVSSLIEEGILAGDARVENLSTGATSGDAKSSTRIVIDRYYDISDGGKLVYTDALKGAIGGADYVICLSNISSGDTALQDASVALQGVRRVREDASAAGVPFVLLSCNLPTDAVRHTDADAVVCAYLSAGFDVDPTVRKDGAPNMRAVNVNVPAALRAIFNAIPFTGTLPISLHELVKDDAGVWAYTDEVIYDKGWGILT